MNEAAASPVLTGLRARMQRLEGGRTHGRTVLPFGIKEIDGRLPGGGLALGALHEACLTLYFIRVCFNLRADRNLSQQKEH